MNPSLATSEPGDGWAVTLAFWGTLLVAGALFAAVALAPRLRLLAELREEHATNQLRLVELERQAVELERIAEALEHDPAFAAELAKLELAAGPSDAERIAVPAALRLGAEKDSATTEELPPIVSTWSVPPALLDPLATHRGLRGTLLAFAVLLVLVAFVGLHVEHAVTARRVVRSTGEAFEAVHERYRKAA